MKTALLPDQISRIMRLAWEDRTSFEEIEKRTGFVQRDVIAVMRRELKVSSFRLFIPFGEKECNRGQKRLVTKRVL